MCASGGTCFELWNIMCSNRCANPVRPTASLAGPTWYHRFTATIGSRRSWLRITSSPFGSVYFSNWSRGMSFAALVAGRFCASDTVSPATRRTRSAGTRILFIIGVSSERLVVEAGPEIPARDRTIRTPRFADSHQPVRRRRFPEPIGTLHGLDDAQVADGQHVGALQAEHQEHLRRPAADAFHRRQRFDHLLVIHGVQRLDRQRAILDAGAEIAKIRQLLSAQADPAQPFI